MSHGLLEVLRYFLLALIWLFFVYAARMVVVEVRRPHGETGAATLDGQHPSERAQNTAALRLRIAEPPKYRGQMFDLGGEITLGRSTACIIRLEDDTFASSVHARVFADDGDLWVEDLQSTNGTYVNDRRVSAPVRLRRGDRLKVGTTVLEVTR